MIDFTWSEPTFSNVLYCTLLYVFFVVIYYGRYVTKINIGKNDNLFMFFLALLMIITFCVDGDWFNYRTMVIEYDLTHIELNHGEPFYAFLVGLVKKNYLFFRIIVWGSAFLMTIFTFKRLEVNPNNAVFFLISIFLIKFNYSRATLGMASYFLGLTFLLKPLNRSKLINLLVSALFFWGAYEFHHSMLLLILMTPIVVFSQMEKPVVIVITLLLLPFLAGFLQNNFFFVDFFENDYISSKMNAYLERQGGTANIFGIIQSLLGYGTFYIPIFVNLFIITRNRKAIAPPMNKLFRLILGITIISSSFMFMGLDSRTFIYRILFMSFIPLTTLTVYLYENNFMSIKAYRFIVMWGILAISFNIFHLLYVYI